MQPFRFKCCFSAKERRKSQILHRPSSSQYKHCSWCLLSPSYWRDLGRIRRSYVVFYLRSLERILASSAFTVGSLGFWECNRMPFGLTNAPATFQRLIENCIGDLNLSSCLLYLDDIVVCSATYEEHIQKLENVFQRLRDRGLKLKPSKCLLFQNIELNI